MTFPQENNESLTFPLTNLRRLKVVNMERNQNRPPLSLGKLAASNHPAKKAKPPARTESWEEGQRSKKK
jgi:hypothetical protein